jgi:hypothetical protein
MITLIYAIYDQASQSYAQPFFAQNDGVAVRIVQSAVNGPERNNITLYPEQFSLWRLGEYNDKTGKIIPAEKPEFLRGAHGLKKQPLTPDEVINTPEENN